ncbi:hypothetical protein B0H16DRAFT_1471349 [Mycena metata]|uniref:Uncharacterized protein n=1 Tax=Mycena metata TaxID=1033252 RepID=A0AAD7HRD4_9AGAR|nr:hypothetical protein B0H16DRAFT_1471349 [Mycena metata]
MFCHHVSEGIEGGPGESIKRPWFPRFSSKSQNPGSTRKSAAAPLQGCRLDPGNFVSYVKLPRKGLRPATALQAVPLQLQSILLAHLGATDYQPSSNPLLSSIPLKVLFRLLSGLLPRTNRVFSVSLRIQTEDAPDSSATRNFVGGTSARRSGSQGTVSNFWPTPEGNGGRASQKSLFFFASFKNRFPRDCRNHVSDLFRPGVIFTPNPAFENT